ncbi:MAG: nuclear transport factor 2 family protein [Patulibacter sp.]|nr:nuclear transport factor 2 family protein [Patulibacter sp.]
MHEQAPGTANEPSGGGSGAVGTIAVAPPVVRGFFEALNAEDWGRMATSWAADAELRAVGARPRRGRAEIMTYYDGLFGPWPQHHDEPTRVIVAGDVVVVEVRFSGTSASGKQIEFDAVDVFDLADGAIRRMTSWYDLAWVRGQL